VSHQRTILDQPHQPLLPHAVAQAMHKARRHGLSFFVHDDKLYVMDGGRLGQHAASMPTCRLDPTERRTWQQCSWNASWRDANEYEIRLWNALGGAT
jgi:hypothetical protein